MEDGARKELISELAAKLVERIDKGETMGAVADGGRRAKVEKTPRHHAQDARRRA